MSLTTHTQGLLIRLQNLLAMSEDEIVQRGIAQAATDRIIGLRQQIVQLKNSYGSLEELEHQVSQGVPADDHSLYTDLLEWRAALYELNQLTSFLEAV